MVLAQSTSLPASPASPVDFDHQVHPLLAAKCHSCHSKEKRSGGLSLGTLQDTLEGGRSGASVKPGNSAGSLLIQRLTGEAKPQMPLGSAPLTEAEITTIRTWIDQGARATPTSAACQSPNGKRRSPWNVPAAPESVWKNWTSPLDRFVAAYLAKQACPQPALVSDAVFARRAYLDIQGLLPPPEELQCFRRGHSTRTSASAGAHRLCRQPQVRRKLDLLLERSAAQRRRRQLLLGNGSRKSITPWLLSSLESNLPYDQFVAKLLNPRDAGDPDGFLIGVNWRGTVSASQTPAMQAAQNTAQIFLGINLKCNSCHDSFISRGS